MQNTRLNSLIATLGRQVSQELVNPWRRLAVLLIALLFGIYLGIALSAIAGQLAYWDVTVAALILLGGEVISWLFHGNRLNFRRSIAGEALYALRIGVTYSLFLIAFMLGS
ncbi:DUF565 domain-containing protein [Lyngbya confervoides]|uniref:DUF565 domain-containing protein n=1 Tax=Lyngbya confervoides BDU141951 TaxID=1574623 RepID=A0ABD4T8B4_9CYAN|nr:DUF565 domain-containing protein [Lyngbya confervoides]MCM1984963.1 DUF565 domain-containing protein [Lyngbya confervoides BDU141951]